ncbi:MAG: D-2-hydroxyacid dehydrogenase [Chloroflexi bacterium]|nr:D-2-hydroxyacid dehydrogenase [Chloroflexota bacterium]
MKIVVLDGYTLNPGDLTWEGLEALGDTTVYDRTPADQVIERSKGAQVLLVNKVEMTREVLAQLPELRYIGVLATGFNVVDIEAARERGIVVANIPTYGTQSVAQMVFAHLLNLTQRVAYHSDTVKAGRWAESEDFCYWDYPLIELHGLTMGVFGFGRIGRNTAQIAKAFGMKVIAFDEYVQDPGDPNVRMVDLETLFRESDALSFHCPLTPETQGVCNAERLSLMKPTAFVINTSRGPVINNADLADALNRGVIAGAGLDVLEVEPPTMDNPLMTAKNVYITPHISWATRSARARLMQTAVDNIKAFSEGRRENVVN